MAFTFTRNLVSFSRFTAPTTFVFNSSRSLNPSFFSSSSFLFPSSPIPNLPQQQNHLLSLSFSTSKPNQFEDLGKVKTFREYEKLLKEPEEDVETAKLFQEKGEQIGFTKDPHPNPGLRRNLPQFADGFSPSVEVVGKLEEIGQRRRVLELMIQGFDERMFEASERIILAAKMLPDAVVKGPTPVKTKLKKYTILKGPFKHKKARDQLGIQRYRRKIVIDTTRDVAEKFFEFLKENTPSLVAIRVKMHDYVPLDELYSFDQESEVEQNP